MIILLIILLIIGVIYTTPIATPLFLCYMFGIYFLLLCCEVALIYFTKKGD